LAEHTFFTKINSSPFELYGGLEGTDTPENVLTKMSETLCNNWETLLAEAKVKGFNIGSSELENTKLVQEKMKVIIKEAVPICPLKVISMKSDKVGNALQGQVEVQQQKETSKQQEKEMDYQYRADAIAIKPLPLKAFSVNKFKIGLGLTEAGITIEPLESMIVANPEKLLQKRSWSFNNNIFVTKNFSQTCEVQPDHMDAYKKDGLFYLVEQEDDNKSISFLLVTIEEATHLSL
jgi:hypothetical protein